MCWLVFVCCFGVLGKFFGLVVFCFVLVWFGFCQHHTTQVRVNWQQWISIEKKNPHQIDLCASLWDDCCGKAQLTAGSVTLRLVGLSAGRMGWAGYEKSPSSSLPWPLHQLQCPGSCPVSLPQLLSIEALGCETVNLNKPCPPWGDVGPWDFITGREDP